MAADRGNGSARKGRPVGTPKTQRLRRLECGECGYLAYVSRRWIATGLPGCPCGGTLMPEDPDDARLALPDDELTQHPAVIEYRRGTYDPTSGEQPPGDPIPF